VDWRSGLDLVRRLCLMGADWEIGLLGMRWRAGGFVVEFVYVCLIVVDIGVDCTLPESGARALRIGDLKGL
jgi:hypothetical protein